MTRFASLLALGALLTLFAISPAPASAEDLLDAEAYYDQISASESYYTLNVEEGSMTVHVDMTFQSAGGELTTVFFWAMPTAENAVITIDGEPLKVAVTPGLVKEGILARIQAPLPVPISGAQRLQAVLEYDVAPHWGSAVRMEPGLMELAFTGQGVGSFVLLDVPVEADTYVDPGCVRASNQPAAIVDLGFERFACGEATLVAMNFDDPEVIRDCARLEDRCRQRFSIEPYSAYVQSVTDESKRGSLEADLVLGDRTVHLQLLYFIADSEWAESQFAIAQKAFPLLEDLFGFEYPFDSLTMRESHKLAELGAAGVAFPTEGELLLTANSFADEEVTVHEMAHQWAGFNLDHPWLWEGQAEWATATIAGQLDIEMYERTWDEWGYSDPLATWYTTSEVTNPDYWYGKAGAFWASYEAAIGSEAMGRVLAATDDDPSLHPLDGRWFMDRGELESGANLDELFLEWVWVEVVVRELIDERRAAWDTVAPLREQLAELGLTGLPTDIQARLDAWSFTGVAGKTETAFDLLDSLAEVQSLAASAGLPERNPIADVWSSLSLDELADRVESQRQAILTISDSEQILSDQPADSPAWDTLEESRAAYAEGDFAGASKLAADAVASVANTRVAAQMVAIAKDRQAEFSPGFFGSIGLLFSDPDGDLAAAEVALAEGDAATALHNARAAYDAWEGANAAGTKMLAIAAAIVAALIVGGWWVLQRANPKPQSSSTFPRDTDGHFLEKKEGKTDWREWGNNSQGDDS